jgi:hypothetical protein
MAMIEVEKPQKLLGKARERLRCKHMSYRTEQRYLQKNHALKTTQAVMPRQTRSAP